ncbi:class I SAM-dependent methyltransferase [Actinomycetospora callitridis]|uniref:class I SAM-dependent methyltransferase n=1 Tax=Actinomycetospora callitridis TaxID=913944 RepID=UPI002366A2D4|nr:class I SAM-dependent methyltransferase [Actinomycetospora callitridis]MDD7920835.1 class I SAM-dependent methyltransferase [Actinomycetospora callitridis]
MSSNAAPERDSPSVGSEEAPADLSVVTTGQEGTRAGRWRWRTPAALYRLISTPALRAVLGWDLPRWDVRWVPAEPGTCLEVGSGGGFYTGPLTRHLPSSATLLSLERHHGSLTDLRSRLADRPGPTLRQVCGDGTRLPLATGSVDVVFLGYCLEEMPDPYRAVAEAHRVLRPGGRLVVFLWRPAITRRRRDPVLARMHELFDVERERSGPQNIRLCLRRPDLDTVHASPVASAAGTAGRG